MAKRISGLMRSRQKPATLNLDPARTAAGKSSQRAAQWKQRRAGGLLVLEAPGLARLIWLNYGFSTRIGGASELPPSRRVPGAADRVLNLGFTDWDSREHVRANRKKFFAAIGGGASKMHQVGLRQIHSSVVHTILNKKNLDAAGTLSGDALITREPGVMLMVQTADCIPILLADGKNRAVAAIHSGWRGTLARIAEKTLGQMQMEFGTDPADVVAAIGPGIGRCCYEVGPEVVQQFEARFPQAQEWFEGPYEKLAAGESDPNWLPWLTMRPPGHAAPPLRAHLDLVAANRAILSGTGVPEGQIFSAELCTACRGDLFFSYRREGATGRMVAAIGIR